MGGGGGGQRMGAEPDVYSGWRRKGAFWPLTCGQRFSCHTHSWNAWATPGALNPGHSKITKKTNNSNKNKIARACFHRLHLIVLEQNFFRSTFKHASTHSSTIAGLVVSLSPFF